MEPIVITVALIIAVGLLFYKYLTWNYGLFKNLGLAGPKPKLLAGSFAGKQNIVYETDEFYYKYKHNHQVIGIFVSSCPQFLILDPKLAHDILVTKFKNFRNSASQNWLYDKKEDKMAAINPFFNTGEEWKNRRLDLITGVTQNKLNLAYPIWQSCAGKLRELLKEQTMEGNCILETKDLITRFTANVLGEFLWGIETHTLSNLNEQNVFLKTAHKISKQLFESVTCYYRCIPFPFLRRFGNYRIFTDDVEQIFSQLTKESFAMRDKDTTHQNRIDFLNYIRQLKNKKQLSHTEMIGYMAAVFVDGSETAATIGYHTLFYLTHHPDCQEKLRAEICSNLEADGSINHQSLHGIAYLDYCVQETLRLISPLSFFLRSCTESTELELNDGRRVPIKKGQMISIPQFSYLHDPAYFSEPWEYKPERFYNLDCSELAKCGIFIPFGDGPRICPGRHMAMLQVKTAVAEVIKSFRLKACEKTTSEIKPNSKTLILGIEGDFLIEYERI